MKNVIHYTLGTYLLITENWIYNQINNLRKYTPYVYCHGTENLQMFPIKNINSINIHSWNPWVLFNLVWNKLFHFYPQHAISMLLNKPHIIHAHFGQSGYSCLKFKQLSGMPLITSFYGQDISMLPKQFPEWKEKYKKLFKIGDKFLIEGNHMKKTLISLGCNENKIIVQHLGVNLETIKFKIRKFKKNNDINILISASFREKKGIPYAIEAFGIVKKNNPELNLKLTIIGDSEPSHAGKKEKEKIYSLLKRYKLEKSVILMGYQPHSEFLSQLYKHHIFLSPSITASDGDTEGGVPVSIIEASASGIPVISTTHCDIPEVIINNKSGFLVPENDIQTLALKLEYMVKNPQIWPQLGLYGRKHIENEYNLKKQIAKLEEIYDQVIKEKCIHNNKNNEIIITTSWDDGHPLDIKLAKLLKKYNIPATFYLPLNKLNDKTMSSINIKKLSIQFDVGGHTLNHLHLTSLPSYQAKKEVEDGKLKLEKIINHKISMFCYPYGEYNSKIISIVKNASYTGARNIKMLSTRIKNKYEIPTTIHASYHPLSFYYHQVNSNNISLFLYLLKKGAFKDWKLTAIESLKYVLKYGGIWHLWGHSWEIEKNNDWTKLEEVFKTISKLKKNNSKIRTLTNSSLYNSI